MRLLVLAVAAMVMAGCGLMSKNEAAGSAYQTDQAKMAAVEQAASRVGVRVIWVNAPQRPAAPAGGS
jgi:uncharacterized protein YceK